MTSQSARIFALQLAELTDVLTNIRDDEFTAASRLIANAPIVHLTGRGRNELAMRAFGNRLMQLGKSVSILGDILAKPVSVGDLVVIASGSGTTSALLEVATAGHALNATILAISRRAKSPLTEQADVTLTIPSLSSGGGTQPLGTLFEQCLGITCDALAVDLMDRLGVTTDAMRTRHANIE